MTSINRQSAIGNRQSDGFTLIELLVVVAILSILVAMLLPALQRAKQTAKLVGCTNNLRQLYLAAFNYASDNNDYPPPTQDETAAWSQLGSYPVTWAYHLMPYLGSKVSGADYVNYPGNHGSLEIRLYGANRCYKYDGGDTTTRKPGPFWCPATIGPWNIWYYSAGAYGCWGDVAIDYAINSYAVGWIQADSSWHPSFPYHIRMGHISNTTAPKLIFIGDAYGYFYRLYLTPSNRHYARGAADNLSGRINCVMWDGHVENFHWDAPPEPPAIVNRDFNEKVQPGWRYYIHP